MRMFLIFLTLTVLVVSLTASVVIVLTTPANASTKHCPDHADKIEGQNNELVLQSGTEFCVKAGPNATGILTADGTRSLSDYVEDTGLRVGKDSVPDVSYYVVYNTALPTPEPDPTITAVPSETPGPEPAPATSPSPWVEPEPEIGEPLVIEREEEEEEEELPVTGAPISLSGIALLMILAVLAFATGHKMLRIAARNE